MTVQLVSSMANDSVIEHMIRGHKATLTFTREGFTIKPQRQFAGEVKEITHVKSGAEATQLHHKNLHAAIRDNATLNCDCMLGLYGVVAAAMGTQALRQQRYMTWDKSRERLVKA
jgi:hypothetical protein